MRRCAGLVLAVTMLVAAGCSSDRRSDGSTTEERDAYAGALAANWRPGGSSGFVLRGSQATCVSERWIDVLGVARLRVAGAEPADIDPRQGGAFDPLQFAITEEQSAAMVGAFDTCGVDVVELFVTARAEGLGEDARRCLHDQLSPALAGAVIEASLRFDEPPDDVLAELSALSRRCGTG